MVKFCTVFDEKKPEGIFKEGLYLNTTVEVLLANEIGPAVNVTAGFVPKVPPNVNVPPDAICTPVPLVKVVVPAIVTAPLIEVVAEVVAFTKLPRATVEIVLAPVLDIVTLPVPVMIEAVSLVPEILPLTVIVLPPSFNVPFVRFKAVCTIKGLLAAKVTEPLLVLLIASVPKVLVAADV